MPHVVEVETPLNLEFAGRMPHCIEEDLC